MKDTRFIELVNLYIDRQLSPEEAAELELEIQTNPRRRQVYLQYCRMHRATKLVYESFRAHAEQQGDAPARQPATIARIEHRQRRRARWSYAAAGMAAAACLTFVVARQNFSGPAEITAEPQTITAARTTPAAPAVAVAANTPAPQDTDARPALVNLRTGLFAEGDYASLLAAARQQEARLLGLGQTRDARVSLFDDGVFEDRAMLRATNNTANRRTRPATEFTAFQFQR